MSRATTTMWDDILAHMRLNHPELVRAWFSSLRPGDLNGGVLTIHTLNDAQVKYLEQYCRTPFNDAAQAATGRLVSVEFLCDQPADADTDDEAATFNLPGNSLKINPDFTFDHFVPGPCNRLAHAAALAVADEPGRAYNPLFVHGPVGLGKTHLLQAICNGVRARNLQARCHYISCETFINDFIEAVERGALHRFRYRYRHVDLLVIDDVQFLAERERSQEEFFHTFNTLHQSQGQIVLSADCSPAEIPSLEERLVSRFNSGLVALLDRPCLETRMAIVRKKARLRCVEVPEDVVRLIADRIDTNIRELEGALLKIDALSQMLNAPINVDLAQEALGTSPVRPVAIPTIVEAVARRFDVRVSDLLGKKRSKAVTYPRHLCMFLARRLTARSLEEIGGYVGGRDHTTVLHATRGIEVRSDSDAELRALLDEITAEVKNAAR